VLRLEELSGVPRYELRPDLYSRPENPPPIPAQPSPVESMARPRRGRAVMGPSW
jgi:hypothetical protein